MSTQHNNILHIATATTTQVTGSKQIHTINITTPFTTFDVYDATSGTTSPIFSVATATGCWIINGDVQNGIRIVSVGTGKATVSYN